MGALSPRYREIVKALEVFAMYCVKNGLGDFLGATREMLEQACLGLEPKGLEQISNLVEAITGHDVSGEDAGALEVSQSPKGLASQQGPTL